jgi:hypothetical protein
MILAGQSWQDFYRGARQAGSGKFIRCGCFSETAGAAAKDNVFHVKQAVHKVNERILLSYTKIPEDHIQDILDINAAK